MRIGMLLGAAAGSFPVVMGLLTLKRAGWPHFGGANLVANGVTLAALALYAWPRRTAWSWWLYAFILLFVGSNDLAILLRAGRLPVTIAPLVLGTAGLALHARAVFGTPGGQDRRQ